jgi:hypothetical protein
MSSTHRLDISASTVARLDGTDGELCALIMSYFIVTMCCLARVEVTRFKLGRDRSFRVLMN